MKVPQYLIVIFCFLCIIAFCAVSISGKIYTLDELPLNFMAALMGAMVTAVITLVLLNGQSTAEEVKKKNVAVYKTKSKLYAHYIKKLNQIIENQPIEIRDFEDVKTEFYSKLTLYLKGKFQKDIAGCIEEVANCLETSITINYFETTKTKTNNYDKLRKNFIKIINILGKDLGLVGKINIDLMMNSEKTVFLKILSATLLQEVINCFSKETELIIKEGVYNNLEKGPYIILSLQGENSSAGEVLIGPFVNSKTKEGSTTLERLHFSIRAPQCNPIAEQYTLKYGNDSGEDLISLISKELQDEYDEIDYVDLSLPLDDNAFEESELDRTMYNDFISPFSFIFEDSGDLYSRYHGIYLDVCKAIATRAYYYFGKTFAISKEENQRPLRLRELCIEMGKVTGKEIDNNIVKQQGNTLEE